MPVELCHDCNASLGTLTQETLPGVTREKRCPTCETQYRGKWMLVACPDPGDGEWDGLNDFEQEFLTSVRGQVARGKSLSEKQYQVLERIYGKA